MAKLSSKTGNVSEIIVFLFVLLGIIFVLAEIFTNISAELKQDESKAEVVRISTISTLPSENISRVEYRRAYYVYK